MKIGKEESGQVLVVTALSMFVLLGFVAFATDVGNMLRVRRVEQTAADAAALAGAAESLFEGTPSTVTSGMWTAATRDAGLDGLAPGSSNGTENSSSGSTLTIKIAPDITVSDFNSAGYVEAIVTQKAPTIFMNLFGFQSMDVTATAIAANTLQSDGCVYVQDNGNNDPNDTVDLNGHSLIAAPTCGTTVNGSINASGSSTINAKFVTASGTITGGDASWLSPVPAPPDPLEYLQQTDNQPTVPGDGTCKVPSTWGFTNGCVLDFNGGNIDSTHPLQSNTVYVFDSSAPPVFAQNSVVTGVTNVAIYLEPNVPLDFMNGTLALSPSTWTSGATSCLDPANENPLCGVLIDAPTDGVTDGTYTCSSGNGNNADNPGEIYFDFGSSSVSLTGIVYAPAMQLFVQDQGADSTFNTDLVIGNICAQSGDLTVNGYSGDYSPIRRVGLVY